MARSSFFSRFGQTPGGPARPPIEDPIDPIIEVLAEPVLVLDDAHVSHANSAARTLLGAHIIGDYARLAIRSPNAAAVLAGDENGPVPITGLGGHDRLWELTAGTIAPGKRLLRLVERSAQRAAEKMRVDFVANASHELRTPLAALIGFIETLEDANSPADAPVRLRFLKIMADEARRMQRLIDDLMSLSRIEADRYSPPRQPIAFVTLVEESLAEIRSARRDGERIEASIAAADSIVIGDRGQLSQLIHNVVSNAFKYGRDHTPIRVSLAERSGIVELAVSDEGEGIAPEHLPRLTERFYRVDASRSRAIGGTGLGLAIVKHIVERHRGKLDIASEVGRGTTVTVTLPLAPPTVS